MQIAQNVFIKKQLFWAIFIFSLHCASHASQSSYFLCRRAMDVRTLRIQTPKDGPCVAWYTKEGLDHKVAESRDSTFCIEVVKQIKETLVWKCKDISSARISY
jgi:hypothetical protein